MLNAFNATIRTTFYEGLFGCRYFGSLFYCCNIRTVFFGLRFGYTSSIFTLLLDLIVIRKMLRVRNGFLKIHTKYWYKSHLYSIDPINHEKKLTFNSNAILIKGIQPKLYS